jgi:hypothetical protein
MAGRVNIACSDIWPYGFQRPDKPQPLLVLSCAEAISLIEVTGTLLCHSFREVCHSREVELPFLLLGKSGRVHQALCQVKR